MTPHIIRAWMIDRENRVVVRALAVSLVIWAGASTATAVVDLGAVLHDATCPDHAVHDQREPGR